jgi:hypothetical protein
MFIYNIYVYVPLVIVSIGAQKETLAVQTAYKNGSINTTFDLPLFSLDRTFKFQLSAHTSHTESITIVTSLH